MKTVFIRSTARSRVSALALGLLLLGAGVSAQTKYQSAGGVNIVIEGTSNIHDWNMKSTQGSCSAIFVVSAAGIPTGLNSLNFTVPAESLKSEHKAMDKNTYKALSTSKYASISFTAASATLKTSGANGSVLTANGKLTISGVTKDVVLTANGVVNPDKSISYSGSYRLKMTDYKVEPPSIMLGAIKTGDDIVVKFNLLLKAI